MPAITTQIATSDASSITIRGKDLVNELMGRCTYTEMMYFLIPAEIMRAIAVVSRCGGLPGHIMEERRTRSARHIWQLAEEHIPYEIPEFQA